MGERIALVAVCALAAAMPGTVLGGLEPELPALAATVDTAVESCLATRPDTGATGATGDPFTTQG
ncbi:hypothetical protein ACIPLC_26860 [Kitasatospora sp. NPDC086801]|uniref:hypothetical protein n=1 Tax=Kitasatospora sp. NPDC086801 TaxID=3364066 RepID=UPI003807AABA